MWGEGGGEVTSGGHRNETGMDWVSAQGVRNDQSAQGHASQENFEIYSP